MSELDAIMAMLHKLDAKQEALAAKVDALAAATPTPRPSFSNLYRPSPSSIPSSPTIAGVDHIPCGPAPSISTNLSSTTPPTLSPLSASPRSPSGGGVEALRLSRQGSVVHGFTLPNNQYQDGLQSGDKLTSRSYSNLSLSSALVGSGAPGPLSPPPAAASNGNGIATSNGSVKGQSALLPPAAMGSDKKEKGLYPSRVVLTTYPGQAGINPIPVNWGAGPTARDRGPVVCSRIKSNLPIRNSIGAHGGSYSVYRALSIAMGQLRPDWRPDLTNTHPPFALPPQPGWFGDGTGRGEEGNKIKWKIVSFDPWGAMSQEVWAKEYADGLDVRPTISQTKAHIKIEELDVLARKGDFPVDGEIVVKSPELAAFPGVDQGVEVNCFKAAIDPVWYLPGVAERLGIEESVLRRALFEDTGGMYPELLTRPDIKIFLPPIGGMTVYIMGDPSKLSDPETEITCRPHDSCSGSDVFGSDICTCRPYLIFGIAEAIKCAQRGGCGVIVYLQREGRALGEVIKYMVYNRRKRGGDTAAEYFNNTEAVAGVKDARHQVMMPDVLHFLGIRHITNLISMSNLKYDAIIDSGITVTNRYEIPAHLIPADSNVEIDAKIQSGYYSTKVVTEDLAKETKGRGWEDIVH